MFFFVYLVFKLQYLIVLIKISLVSHDSTWSWKHPITVEYIIYNSFLSEGTRRGAYKKQGSINECRTNVFFLGKNAIFSLILKCYWPRKNIKNPIFFLHRQKSLSHSFVTRFYILYLHPNQIWTKRHSLQSTS